MPRVVKARGLAPRSSRVYLQPVACQSAQYAKKGGAVPTPPFGIPRGCFRHGASLGSEVTTNHHLEQRPGHQLLAGYIFINRNLGVQVNTRRSGMNLETRR